MREPLEICLCDTRGFELRQEAARWVEENLNTTGAERGNPKQQSYGKLAELVIRDQLGMTLHPSDEQDLGYDLKLESGVRVDVKCRGGKKPFSILYDHNDGLPREAKHNLWARQVFEENASADVYLMCHLRSAGNDGVLPGTARQRNWRLFVCGWVSKSRARREGVYVPRGRLSERGRDGWMPYRGQEVEFFDRNLVRVVSMEEFARLNTDRVREDEQYQATFNLTNADARRLVLDMNGRRLIGEESMERILDRPEFDGEAPSIYCNNQYLHLAEWLRKQDLISEEEQSKINDYFPRDDFTEV